tara:strand:+ start:174 stop:614 length:441 start_codon:yes stop_codon:yes gene_type:complete
MNKLFKKLGKEKHHLLLAGLLAAFIVLDIELPLAFANLVDTIVGKTVVILVVFSLLTYNKFVGVLAIVAGYMLVMRAMHTTGNKNMTYLETELTKARKMRGLNIPHKTTVEEEVINNMLPRVSNESVTSYDFKPVQGNVHDAERLA